MAEGVAEVTLKDYSHRLDEHGALKPNGWFWVCIAVQLEPIFLIAVEFFLAQSQLNILVRVVGLKDGLIPYMLVSLPALLMVIAYWTRRPEAKIYFRQLWQWGRWLLALGFIGHLGLDIARLAHYGLRLDSLSVFFIIVKAWLLLILLVKPYLKALFASFPESD